MAELFTEENDQRGDLRMKKQVLVYVHNLHKTYFSQKNGVSCHALSGMEFRIYEGDFIAVMGASGSGKSTLLNMLSGCDYPDKGEIFIGDRAMSKLKKKELAVYRRDEIGIIFQQFHLSDYLTALENIMVPAVLAEKEEKAAGERARMLADRLHIKNLLEKYPYELSGGEKQRCAIARALMNSPKLLLADEPTGQLDRRSSENFLQILESLNREGQTIFMTTHDPYIGSRAGRVIFIQDGKIYHELRRETEDREEFYGNIMETLSETLFAEQKTDGEI